MKHNFVTLKLNKRSPIIATAIHDGDFLRPELLAITNLSVSERRREEDPFTGKLAQVAPSSLTCLKSRFEYDLNRPREKAVYKTPADAWGLNLWKEPLKESAVEDSLNYYDAFYKQLYNVYSELIAEHGKIVVLDLHSYNYRRKGPNDVGSPETTHPTINLGTGTMTHQGWRPLINNFVSDLRKQSFLGKALNVQENLIFKGGYHPLWAHQTFAEDICVLSIEFKKCFMDEWSGELYSDSFSELKEVFSYTIDCLSRQLKQINNQK